MQLQILPPLSNSLTPLRGVPPLGALLVMVPVSTPSLDAALELVRIARSHPWCPIIMPPIVDPAAFEPLGVPASRVLLIDLEDDPAAWRLAVRCRPLPSYREWISALGVRTDARISESVRWVFERVSEGSGIRRQLRRLGLPTPGDWRDIFSGCICLGDALRTGDTIAVVAERHGLTGTGLASIAKRCFGMGWHQLRALGAWEPGLEQALRFKKVVKEPPTIVVAGLRPARVPSAVALQASVDSIRRSRVQ